MISIRIMKRKYDMFEDHYESVFNIPAGNGAAIA